MTYGQNDLDWSSIMAAFVPPSMYKVARDKYTELLNADDKERIRMALRNVERRYVPFVNPDQLELHWDGTFKPIGVREAMCRRSNCVQMQVLDAVRRELNIK